MVTWCNKFLYANLSNLNVGTFFATHRNMRAFLLHLYDRPSLHCKLIKLMATNNWRVAMRTFVLISQLKSLLSSKVHAKRGKHVKHFWLTADQVYLLFSPYFMSAKSWLIAEVDVRIAQLGWDTWLNSKIQQPVILANIW